MLLYFLYLFNVDGKEGMTEFSVASVITLQKKWYVWEIAANPTVIYAACSQGLTQMDVDEVVYTVILYIKFIQLFFNLYLGYIWSDLLCEITIKH